MNRLLNFRFGLLLLALAALGPLASAQVDPGKGSTSGGSTGGDDPIFPGGGVNPGNPPNTPEPFTMALGAGALGLYARRRYVKSRHQAA